MYEQGILEMGIRFEEASFILRRFHVVDSDKSAVFSDFTLSLFFCGLGEPAHPQAVTSTSSSLYVVSLQRRMETTISSATFICLQPNNNMSRLNKTQGFYYLHPLMAFHQPTSWDLLKCPTF